MTRLDDIFLTISFGAILLLGKADNQSKIIRSIYLITIPFLAILAYLTYNHITVGTFLPISGMVKTNFAIEPNLHSLLGIIYARYNGIFLSIGSWRESWSELSYRGLQLIVPLALAGYYSWKIYPIWRQKRLSPIEEALLVFSLYILFKGLYDLFVVQPYSRGHWYFPISVISANILLIYWISIFIQDKFKQSGFWKPYVLSFVIIVIIANSFINYKYITDYNGVYYKLWENRIQVKDSLKKVYPQGGLIEFDDGIISYSLNWPTISGLGFAMDKQAYEAKQNGDLLELAYARGYSAFTSLVYLDCKEPIIENPEALSRYVGSLFYMQGQKYWLWDYKLVYKDIPTNLCVIGFQPKSVN